VEYVDGALSVDVGALLWFVVRQLMWITVASIWEMIFEYYWHRAVPRIRLTSICFVDAHHYPHCRRAFQLHLPFFYRHLHKLHHTYKRYVFTLHSTKLHAARSSGVMG
jgi:hypothetical protein